MIALPDQGMLITQDLVYHAHAFVGEKAFDTWARALETYRDLGTARFFPDTAYQVVRNSTTECFTTFGCTRRILKGGKWRRFETRFFAAFPGYRDRLRVDHEMRFLFPPQNAAATLQTEYEHESD
jgi:hypothetical protein